VKAGKVEMEDADGKKYSISANALGLDDTYTIYDESDKEFCSMIDVFTFKKAGFKKKLKN